MDPRTPAANTTLRHGFPAICSILWVCLGLPLAPVRALESGALRLPTVTSNRLVALAVEPPTGAEWVKLSRSPEFGETNGGVTIEFTAVDPDLRWVDLNVVFPGGPEVTSPPPPPSRRAWESDLRILVIPTRFTDGGTPPPYVDTPWLERLFFSTNSGPDARNLPNSLRNWIDQNTYGRIRVSGEVYPEWVAIDTAEHYNDLTGQEAIAMVVDASRAIRARQPDFFAHRKFDMVVLLTPGDLSVVTRGVGYEQSGSRWADPEGLFESYLIQDLPVGAESLYQAASQNERRVSTDERHVVTRLDAPFYAIAGVWLATDTNRAGVNFYPGGSVGGDLRTLTLGAPLPAAHTEVVIDYQPTLGPYRVLDPNAPLLSSSHTDSWLGTLFHEFNHAMGWHYSGADRFVIGDLYSPPTELIGAYGLMANGGRNWVHGPSVEEYVEPSHLDAYTKYRSGLLRPLEVTYGARITQARLWATEEWPPTDQLKLIKVPLHPPATPAQLRRPFSPTTSMELRGEEYLLIELRRKGPLEGHHNFDAGLPHEGPIIYHVLEKDPFSHGLESSTMVRIVDATPPSLAESDPTLPFGVEEYVSLILTPAPFGPASGVLHYHHSDPWQFLGDNPAPWYWFLFEKSETVHAKFRDAKGVESRPISATVTVDVPVIPVLQARDLTLREGTGDFIDAEVEVWLDPPPLQTAQVDFSLQPESADFADFIPLSGTLTFAPGTTRQTVAVRVLSDAAPESDETFRLELYRPVNARISQPFATITIIDDDDDPTGFDHLEIIPPVTPWVAGQSRPQEITARRFDGTVATRFAGTIQVRAYETTTNAVLRIGTIARRPGDSPSSPLAAMRAAVGDFQLAETTEVGGPGLGEFLRDKDVLWISESSLSRFTDLQADMRQTGFQAREILNEFLQSGGTLLACGANSAVGYLSGAEAIGTLYANPTTGYGFHTISTHPLTAGIGLDVQAFPVMPVVLTFGTPILVTADAHAVVGAIHEAGPGLVAYLGYDFAEHSPTFQRFLANVLRAAYGRRTIRLSTPTPLPEVLTFAAGQSLTTVRWPAATDLTRLEFTTPRGRRLQFGPWTVLADTDADGLPDTWETEHGFQPGDATDAALDVDADGQSNLAEFLSGTDPHDAAQVVRLTAARFVGDTLEVTVATRPGRTYILEHSATANTGPWTTSTRWIATETGSTVTIPAGAASTLFARVQALP